MAKKGKSSQKMPPMELPATELYLNPKSEPNLVRPVGIVLVAVYLVTFTLGLFFGLLSIWTPQSVNLEAEVRLILIVLFSGALGSMMHALRSFFWYVGNRNLVTSWIMKYILLPFSGATLALLFYLVLRAGLFSPDADVDATSVFGFAGVAGLVGMFSEQAVEKLKEVASTIFKPAKEGEDHVASKDQDRDYD